MGDMHTHVVNICKHVYMDIYVILCVYIYGGIHAASKTHHLGFILNLRIRLAKAVYCVVIMA